ncbi:MAG: flagellar hook-length control protein FliK [Lachnobacterium sp.]|nr:flagellar hook-length control protein FliK [Lachnobacterium sp.]
MTSANVFNLGSVGQGQNLNANAATSKTKVENSGAAAAFSSIMNGNYSTNHTANTKDIVQTSIKTNDTDRAQNSYTRYSGRDTKIASATMNDKISKAADQLDDFDQKVVAKVAEDLGVDEEAVRTAMETLGITALGLMDPQNLAQLTGELTGASTPEDLLLQPQFVDLMQDMQSISGELMDQLDLMPEEMQKLLAQMDTLETPQVLEDASFAEGMNQAAEQNAQPDVTVNADKVQADEIVDTDASIQPGDANVAEPVAEEAKQSGQFSSDNDGSNAENLAQRENEVHTSDRTDAHVTEQTPEMVFTTDQILNESMVQAEDASYLPIDTMDLIEQFAENVKVTVAENASSMEMQLNPENLGKVYLQISSEQGSVRAQIAASNEAVKAALEIQVAELRETLEQSGIKVDSIEVTVASHEFERNLEQGQSREFEEGQRQQEQQSQRRNINLSSLDELSSLMTEEEALVAQIMKDNGNSVDLTA